MKIKKNVLKSLLGKFRKQPSIASANATNNIVTKSVPGYNDYYRYAYEHWLNMGEASLTAQVAISYYMRCSAINSAIDFIATEIATIPPRVFDTQTEEWVEDHPVLEFLEEPNADSVYEEFIYAFASYLLITGNNYCITTGALNRPPLEISLAKPQTITILPSGSDGYANTFQVSTYHNHIMFKRDDERDGRFRYYNADYKNGAFREIYQTKNFNPVSGTESLYGLSPLTAIFLEIEQHINSNVHNLSLLERGARPSGFIKVPDGLSDEIEQKMREEINRTASGAQNAGRPLLLQGEGVDFIEAQKSNIDMDFLNLKKEIKQDIYTKLRIPMPLISSEHTSYSNMAESRLMFYDNSVLPMMNRIFAELTNLLMYRYPNSGDLVITYKEDDIIALQPRRNEELKKLHELGVFTKNEIRQKVGYEDMRQGGHEIYAPIGQLPIASNDEDSDFDLFTLIDDEPLPDELKKSRDNFVRIMRRQVDKEGERRFADEEINTIADKHGLV